MKCANPRCEKEFTPTTSRQKYCSARCRNRVKCRKYYRRHKEEQIKRKTEYYYKKKKEDPEWVRRINKRANDNRYYGEPRENILERFNNQCVYCGSDEDLVIHHLDNQGRVVDDPNNDKDNKVVCCRACHAKIHLCGQELEMKI